MSYDRSLDVKTFDESKIGVKGLIDSGVTSLPSIFIHPQDTLDNIKAGPTHGITIPTIDLCGVESHERPAIMKKVSNAAAEFGFFQVVNHGVPLKVMHGVLGAIKGFHEQNSEDKKRLYTRDTDKGVAFLSNIDLLNAKSAGWRDTLQVRLGHNRPELEEIPAICRNELVEWDKEANRVAEMLLELLCEGLGVEKDRLKNLSCSTGRVMVGQYYPPCPQPDLTLGISSHTDPDVLTVLVQDHVGGLQVKYGDGWLNVKPVPGALVVNIGDLLQIMSNEVYKSVDHRALANSSNEPRISVGTFLHPIGRERLLGPFPELIAENKPAIYKQFTIADFIGQFHKTDIADKSLPGHFKL